MGALQLIAPRSRELAYAEITSTVSGITSEADVEGLSITFTAPPGPVYVEVELPALQQVTSAGTITVKLANGAGTEQLRIGSSTAVPAGSFVAGYGAKRKFTTLTPGTSYTFKVRASTSAGTLSIFSIVSYAGMIRAYEVVS